jgi:NAD(P)-dependent dehydrogenase (short-subunit alcohol dehydrogenase family)
MAPKTVLITGASSGIGRALALEYASRGAHVAVAARRKEELDQLVREIEQGGGRAKAYVVDVSDPAAAADVVRKADADLGALEMVIANAGAGYHGHAATMKWEDVSRVLDVNVRGAIATLHAAIPIFLAHKGGHLVGVTSLAGRRGLPQAGPYSASKAAVSIFLETLRIDLATAGIRVTDVQPGFVDTPMTKGSKHPMPFLWGPKRAARFIVRRLAFAPAVVAFPWPLALLTRLARSIPPFIYDRLTRAMSG